MKLRRNLTGQLRSAGHFPYAISGLLTTLARWRSFRDAVLEAREDVLGRCGRPVCIFGGEFMRPYALAGHVFACLDRDHVVLLDLKRDRYFSFDAKPARDLESVFSDARIATPLLAQGLLVHSRDSAQTPSRTSADLPAATAELTLNQYDEEPPHLLGHVARFAWATAVAAGMLRFSSIERAVTRVRKRNTNRESAAHGHDLRGARELLAVFRGLQPFLFTSREACLFESFVLMEFLAGYSLFPTWVFGVRARPFAAHCWVQQDSVVLNDSVEHVSRYTPIMAV